MNRLAIPYTGIPLVLMECQVPLQVPYEERIRKQYHHFAMTEQVTLYKFHTDTGLVGLGESVGPTFAQEFLDPYIGTDPFDHVMSTGPFNLDMACCDLMGKHLVSRRRNRLTKFGRRGDPARKAPEQVVSVGYGERRRSGTRPNSKSSVPRRERG